MVGRLLPRLRRAFGGFCDGVWRVTYELGIDLGTTWTAAAVWRGERATIVNLGTRQAAVPSIVYVGPDGSVLIGEAAERRVLTEPERVAAPVQAAHR